MNFLLLLLSLSCATTSKPQPVDVWMDLQGHRGARGARPENTKSAFLYAIEHDMTTLELDTVLTADGHLVVHHDVDTNPKLCTEENGVIIEKEPIRTLTLAQLQLLNCGAQSNPKFPEQVLSKDEKLMSLEEFFAFIKEQEQINPSVQNIRFNIELKFPQNVSSEDIALSVERVVTVIEAAEMVERSSIQSFLLDSLPLVQKRNPNISLSALFTPTKREAITAITGSNSAQTDIIEKAVALKVETISPHHLYVNAQFVEESHKVGLKVIPWTVNDSGRMLELMRLGVDGIISDYPTRLTKAHQQYKLELSQNTSK